ncbi:MAG: PTS sugar transporter subunit IIC [Cardiobacteriaceae bacterium]|nr:PTS sugar transporter subunit IIC [Cardiobacteriaceae bacterium]
MSQIQTNPREFFKSFARKYFLDAFTGMALGLFVTLIAGLIFKQIGIWTGLQFFISIGALASTLMGAGIGAGIAGFLKAPPLVVFSCIVAGFLGAHSSEVVANTAINYSLPGNPVAAYLCAVIGYRLGVLVAGKSSLDILFIPAAVMIAAYATAAFLCPSVVAAVNAIGAAIQAATQLQPFLMGVVISVAMGLLLTLPTSSAAIGIAIGLGGIAGGAATVGCAAHMVGFAVISWRDNGLGGAIAQGLGTSMLQIPNVLRKPILFLPVIIASAIVGPLATCVFHLPCVPSGAGMGTSGLVGVFGIIDAVKAENIAMSDNELWFAIILLMFVLPALISWAVAFVMRKKSLILDGDLKILR